MLRLKSFLLFLFLAGGQCQDHGFTEFLENAMKGYPQWLRSNQLDPTTHFVTLNYTSGLMELEGCMCLLQISNYSDAIENADIQVRSNLLQGRFDITIHDGFFKASDIYNLDGTILGFFDVSGHGDAQMDVHADQYELATYTVLNFGLTRNGFIDLSEALIFNSEGSSMQTTNHSFENLSAPGFEEDVLEVLKQTIDRQIREWNNHQFVDNLTRYLTEIFAQTPINDIIGISRK